MLREIEEKDADLIVRLRSNPDEYRFFANPHRLTKEEHLRWYRDCYLKDENRASFVAFLTESEKTIGLFGFQKMESAVAEVSYLSERSERRKGYAAEALSAVMRWSSSYWGIRHAIAEIHRDNTASIRFAEGLSFSLEGERGDFLIYGKDLSENE